MIIKVDNRFNYLSSVKMEEANKMLPFLLLAAVFLGMVNGDSMHHLRHHGMVTQALRERLGLGAENSSVVNLASMDQGMLLTELRKVVSSLQEMRKERMARRMMTDSQEMPEQKPVISPETEEAVVQRVVMTAMKHVLKNLQTVEGGQEAANWLKTLRKEASSNQAETKDDTSSLGDSSSTRTTMLLTRQDDDDDKNTIK